MRNFSSVRVQYQWFRSVASRKHLKNECSLQVFHLSWLRKSFLLCNGAVVRKNDQRMCSSSRRRGREKKVSSIAFDVAFTSQKDLSIERSRKSKSKLFYTLAKRIRIARLVYVFNSIFNDVERTFGIWLDLFLRNLMTSSGSSGMSSECLPCKWDD